MFNDTSTDPSQKTMTVEEFMKLPDYFELIIRNTNGLPKNLAELPDGPYKDKTADHLNQMTLEAAQYVENQLFIPMREITGEQKITLSYTTSMAISQGKEAASRAQITELLEAMMSTSDPKDTFLRLQRGDAFMESISSMDSEVVLSFCKAMTSAAFTMGAYYGRRATLTLQEARSNGKI